MSKSEVLYVKRANKSDTDDNSVDQTWDDKELKDAYYKALVIHNIEVAKRVAMSTNTSSPTGDTASFPKKENMPSKSSMKKHQTSKVSKNVTVDEGHEEAMWGPGMPCRSIYKEDSLEYEAVIVKLVDHDLCIVRYLGYENEELVSLDSLMPSHGKEVRAQQITEAMIERGEENFANITPSAEFSDQVDHRGHTPDSMDRESPKKKKTSKKKKNHSRNMNINGFEFPEIPHMPNFNMLSNHIGSSEMPMPPPPMAFSPSLHRIDSEDQAVSSMLLSWYMSGYYTGLYQGMKRAREERRN